MLLPRTKNITSIQYRLITKDVPVISTFTPPNAFLKNYIILFLKNCPEDLFQFHDSLTFYEVHAKQNMHNGYDFGTIFSENFEAAFKYLLYPKRARLFFIDAEVEGFRRIYENILAESSILNFFHFFNLPIDNRNDFVNFVHSPFDFVKSIFNSQSEILNEINCFQKEIQPSVQLQYKDFAYYHYFLPTRNNTHLLERIVGNFGGDADYLPSDDDSIKGESRKAMEDFDSWERQDLFVEQIGKVDGIKNLAFKAEIIKPVIYGEPLYSSLVLCIPFHNPDIFQGASKVIQTVLKGEQTNNYVVFGDLSGVDKQVVAEAASLNFERLKYLDDVGFLHASFLNSPYVRLPIKGKSLYRDLSFFRTENFGNLSSAKTPKRH